MHTIIDKYFLFNLSTAAADSKEVHWFQFEINFMVAQEESGNTQAFLVSDPEGQVHDLLPRASFR